MKDFRREVGGHKEMRSIAGTGHPGCWTREGAGCDRPPWWSRMERQSNGSGERFRAESDSSGAAIAFDSGRAPGKAYVGSQTRRFG
ncbi:unnamed protein product [Heligmosomoides polygyrus]|uniref:Uncharacterized protein n=1 Tax=Heligmosomoides polygyrus TaxID=6339 RepID=A0A183F2H4_HELPZ|nr:unnamed protein product [Heligmosomoides polygyrus]